MTPTIIVQKPDELLDSNIARSSNPALNASSSTLTNEIFFNDDSPKYKEATSKVNNAKVALRHSFSEHTKSHLALNSAQFIENSLVEYFQMATLNNTFDLYKIVEVAKKFSINLKVGC